MLVERRPSGHRVRRWLTRRLPGPSLSDAPGGGCVPEPAGIVLPEAAPAASVVIPAFGNAAETLRCLGSLAPARGETPFEVVIVDDGSPPGSLDALAAVAGARVVRSDVNRGFVAACNLGAACGRAPWLVFLNNDTVVTDGWLDRLVETAESRPRAGAVGARLLFEDGRLQEAGGIVWSDASAHNVGRGEHPDAPPYGYVRAVDYCSGACLLISARLFGELGGFDEAFAPAYYEDVDLAFRVRAAGLEVLYQPLATVFHSEGATAGRDPTRGAKRFQVTHRETLARRWPRELASRPPRGSDPLLAKDRGALGRCLVVDQGAPTPDRDAGSQRMVHVLRALAELGWKVTFSASRPVGRGDDRAVALGQLGVECLTRPFERSLGAHLRRRGADYDAVWLSRPAVAARWAGPVRRHCRGALTVYDAVDLRWRRLEGAALHQDDRSLRTQARRSRRRELALARRLDRVVVTTGLEGELVRGEVAEGRIHRVPTFYPIVERISGFEERRGVLFVGGFRHLPNRDAALWLVGEILPRVREVLGPVPLWLIGEAPPAELVARAGRDSCLGAVDDLGPWLQRARVSVAPLLWGAGLKGKVHQSLASGLPCVATPVAAEGFEAHPGRDLLVAEVAPDLAAGVVSLHSDRALWEEVSAAGLRLVRDRYGWESFRAAVAGAVGPPPTEGGREARSARKERR
jgi:GT2 family glycosyltransferase/glycosyltransferase involved in cell wall biosynthesis